MGHNGFCEHSLTSYQEIEEINIGNFVEYQNTWRYFPPHQQKRGRQKKRNRIQKSLLHQLTKFLKTIIISAKTL
jgi:hypothetical protein